MKYILTFLLLISAPAFADDGDFLKAEVVPDVVSYKLDTVTIYAIGKTCEVVYRKIDSNGEPSGNDTRISFIDDEGRGITDFTDLMNAINNGSNIRKTIKNASKIKMGI